MDNKDGITNTKGAAQTGAKAAENIPVWPTGTGIFRADMYTKSNF